MVRARHRIGHRTATPRRDAAAHALPSTDPMGTYPLLRAQTAPAASRRALTGSLNFFRHRDDLGVTAHEAGPEPRAKVLLEQAVRHVDQDEGGAPEVRGIKKRVDEPMSGLPLGDEVHVRRDLKAGCELVRVDHLAVLRGMGRGRERWGCGPGPSVRPGRATTNALGTERPLPATR